MMMPGKSAHSTLCQLRARLPTARIHVRMEYRFKQSSSERILENECIIKRFEVDRKTDVNEDRVPSDRITRDEYICVAGSVVPLLLPLHFLPTIKPFQVDGGKREGRTRVGISSGFRESLKSHSLHQYTIFLIPTSSRAFFLLLLVGASKP